MDDELSNRLELWKGEQYEVATKVKIVLDKPQTVPVLVENLPDQLAKSQNTSGLYGGVDVCFPVDEKEQAVATYVIVDERQNLEVVYRDYLNFDQTVPYISSFLSFREIDSLEFLVRKQLREKPDLTPRVILVDGNGILHVRRAGIACFLGTRTGLPTIGIGKTLYCEEGLNKELVKAQIDDTLNFLVSEEGTLGLKKKDIEFVVFTLGLSSKTKNDTQKRREDALDELCTTKCRGVGVKLKVTGGETLACALIGHGGKIGGLSKQNKRGTKNPIFISIGHGVSLEDAVKMSVRISKARIPEPVRQADLWGRELIRERNVK